MPDQDQLARAHFVVVGAGGLGCPALLGLSAAGAQRLTIIDLDRVEASNLQRQVLYALADLGRPKADAAASNLHRRVASVQVSAQVRAVAPEQADAFIAELPAESYESPPTADVQPTCATAGVLGVAAGLAGFVMANLAVVLADGNPAPETTGTLTAFDVRGGAIQSLHPTSRPGCPACAAATPTRFPPLQAAA